MYVRKNHALFFLIKDDATYLNYCVRNHNRETYNNHANSLIFNGNMLESVTAYVCLNIDTYCSNLPPCPFRIHCSHIPLLQHA